jgi:hypothetical protein
MEESTRCGNAALSHAFAACGEEFLIDLPGWVTTCPPRGLDSTRIRSQVAWTPRMTSVIRSVSDSVMKFNEGENASLRPQGDDRRIPFASGRTSAL